MWNNLKLKRSTTFTKILNINTIISTKKKLRINVIIAKVGPNNLFYL